METLIKQYLDSKKFSWAETTKKSQASRLLAVAHLIGQSPAAVWETLVKTQAPYTRKQTFSAICDFYDFLIAIGNVTAPNIYTKWKADNARQFKHVYERKYPDMSMSEAKRRIDLIEDLSIRKKALELLFSGMRYTESFTYTDGKVTGKGSKVRSVCKPEIHGEDYKGAYITFWRALNFVGLKPHDLRKLAASQLHKSGMDAFDLCHVMGWSDPKTAMSYVRPDTEKVMMDRIKKAMAV